MLVLKLYHVYKMLVEVSFGSLGFSFTELQEKNKIEINRNYFCVNIISVFSTYFLRISPPSDIEKLQGNFKKIFLNVPTTQNVVPTVYHTRC